MSKVLDIDKWWYSAVLLYSAGQGKYNILANFAVCRVSQSASRMSRASPTFTPSIASAIDKGKRKKGDFKILGRGCYVLCSKLRQGHCQITYLLQVAKILLNSKYRAYHLLVDSIVLTWILSVELFVQFCLDWWEFGRSGWERSWNIQIKCQPNPSPRADGTLLM